jgi:putative two-component system response regulator
MKVIQKNFSALLITEDVSLQNTIPEILLIKDINTIIIDTLKEVDSLIDVGLFSVIIIDYSLENADALIKGFKTKVNNVPIICVLDKSNEGETIAPLISGATAIINKPFRETELLMLANNLISLSEAFEKLEHAGTVIYALCRALDTRDTYTEGHSERVANLSLSIYDGLNLKNNKQRESLYYGALLHDIGKIGIADNILKSTDKFAPGSKEYEEIKKHPEIGYLICSSLGKLNGSLGVILYHHEKLDGSGYPKGLEGDSIPLIAKVVTVADIYDALTSKRAYRDKMNPKDAIDIIMKEGKQGKLDFNLCSLLKKAILQE